MLSESNEPLLRKGFVSGGFLRDVIAEQSTSSDALDEFWMIEAFRESMKSVGRCNPNPAVGCVIVKDGVEIARGHTQPFGGHHAEREAFEKVKNKELLQGATVYVTLEPCSHFGRQPPCADLLLNSPISRVVIGRHDLDVRVNGEGIQHLLKARKKVRVGVLSAEITAWNHPFFFSRIVHRPFFALKWAQTLDGQLADDQGVSRWITGRNARAYTHWLRQKYDAILVGAGTFIHDAPRLTVRDCSPIERQPVRVVFDPKGRLVETSLEARKKINGTCFHASEAPIFVLVGKESDRSAVEKFYPGSRALRLPEGGFDKKILQGLESGEIREALGKPLQSVLVEGGPSLLTECVSHGYADIIHAMIAPLLTGGKDYRIAPKLPLSSAKRFQMLALEALGGDTLLELVEKEMWGKMQVEGGAGCCAS